MNELNNGVDNFVDENIAGARFCFWYFIILIISLFIIVCCAGAMYTNYLKDIIL